ncbi:plasmid stability protein [Microbacterium sp. ZKA21]
MLICMRTTLNLSDSLARAAKARAASEGRTFTSFLEDALRDYLAREEPVPGAHPLPTHTPKIPGALVDLDDKDAVWDALDKSA